MFVRSTQRFSKQVVSLSTTRVETNVDNMDEDAELKRLWAEVYADIDEYEPWSKLVAAAENLEGGLHRNSSPSHIGQYRQVYDRFLARFPLFFGYWKKYADMEFNIGGTEPAEMVYERGVASISSVDLWTQYCEFKSTTCHKPDIIRELFERGATAVGLDFLAHPFWDKYIEFEERQEDPERVFAILGRVIHIPMHQYARYYERFSRLAPTREVREVKATGPPELVAQIQAEAQMEASTQPNSTSEQVDQVIRARINAYHTEIFQSTQNETTKRWTFEQEIKRPYFHVTELEDTQLANWRKYLDFEEAEGNFDRITFLYERCVVACANYDEFWQRYARWMLSQPNKTEEVRNIYIRAACIYVPIARPEIRLHWALFEESQDRLVMAHDIYEAMLTSMPGHVDTIVAWADSMRRHHGLDAAVQIYKGQMASESVEVTVKASLVAKLARFLYRVKGAPQEARAAFQQHQNLHLNNREFWAAWLNFENEQPVPTEAALTEQCKRMSDLWETVRLRSALSTDAIKDLSSIYMSFLTQRGGSGVAAEYIQLDREMHGYSK